MTTDEKLYTIINHPQQLTDEQVEDLLNDPQLTEDCKSLLAARRLVRQSRPHADVEEALRIFKRKHEEKSVVSLSSRIEDGGKDDAEPLWRNRRRIIQLSASLLAVAAMLATVVFLMRPKPVDLRQVCEVPMVDSVVQITDADGEELPQTKSHPTILTTAKQVVVDATQLDNSTRAASITIPYGKEAVVCLPDNSKVYLHPGSRLVFPCRFADDLREVHLEGEAYFSLTHDAEKPFVVITKRSLTRVYGTEFDVTSRPGKPELVTLVSGRVAVGGLNCLESDGHLKADAEPQLHHITPGSQAVVSSQSVTVRPVDTEAYTMWRDGYLYFDNTPLSEILKTLSEYYKVNVKCYNDSAKTLRMRFFVRRTDSIQDVVESLNNMQQVKVSLKGSDLLVF